MREKLCYCTEKSLVPIQARKNDADKWELFTISGYYESGNAMYKIKMINDEFDELVVFNSNEQTSYIAISKNNLWRLIVIWENFTPECDWEYVSEFNFTDLEILLDEYYVNPYDFMII